MSAIVISILATLAARVGAPLIKNALESAGVGKVGTEVAGTIIDTIAGKLGVEPDKIPEVIANDPKKVEQAVIATERETPDLILAQVKQQEEANKLMIAEMQKETAFAWAWRPAWMWFLMFCWGWTWVIIPTVNGAFSASVPAIPSDALIWVTTVYTGLYMGGHTIQNVATKVLNR